MSRIPCRIAVLVATGNGKRIAYIAEIIETAMKSANICFATQLPDPSRKQVPWMWYCPF